MTILQIRLLGLAIVLHLYDGTLEILWTQRLSHPDLTMVIDLVNIILWIPTSHVVNIWDKASENKKEHHMKLMDPSRIGTREEFLEWTVSIWSFNTAGFLALFWLDKRRYLEKKYCLQYDTFGCWPGMLRCRHTGMINTPVELCCVKRNFLYAGIWVWTDVLLMSNIVDDPLPHHIRSQPGTKSPRCGFHSSVLSANRYTWFIYRLQ